MAYSLIWPPTLPQRPQQNYSETGGVNILRTSVDKGPAKQRRTGKRLETMQVTFHMSTSQVDTLKNFVENSIRGTIRFGFPHPRLNTVVEARMIPQEDGLLYNINYVMLNVWDVSFQIEVLS